jgi:hypothetical protein
MSWGRTRWKIAVEKSRRRGPSKGINAEVRRN